MLILSIIRRANQDECQSEGEQADQYGGFQMAEESRARSQGDSLNPESGQEGQAERTRDNWRKASANDDEERRQAEG